MIDEINECESGVMCTNFNNCESHDAYQRRDFHGFGTGHWCDDCYDSSAYPLLNEILESYK